MKRTDLTIWLTLVCSALLCWSATGYGLAQDQTALDEPAQDNTALSAPAGHNPFWKTGEKLVYRVEAKGIPVGSQVLTVIRKPFRRTSGLSYQDGTLQLCRAEALV